MSEPRKLAADGKTIEQHAAPSPRPTSTLESQLSLFQLFVLHLAPGAAVAIVFLVLAPVAFRLHLPALVAQLLAGVVALLPLEFGVLWLAARRLNGSCSMKGVLLYRLEWRGWRYPLAAVGLCCLSVAMFMLLQPLNSLWQQAFFSWIPAHYLVSGFQQYAGYSRPVLAVVFSAQLVLNGILFPLAEELYFRGYLLPRMSRFGLAAPVLNAAFFALYHLWQPYNLPTLFFVVLPMVFGTWKTRNLCVGIYTHVLFNTIGGTLALLMVLRGSSG
jgi:hypothetical protein